MSHSLDRRTFVRHAGLFLASAQLAPWLKLVHGADLESAVGDTSTGKVRKDLLRTAEWAGHNNRIQG